MGATTYQVGDCVRYRMIGPRSEEEIGFIDKPWAIGGQSVDDPPKGYLVRPLPWFTEGDPLLLVWTREILEVIGGGP